MENEKKETLQQVWQMVRELIKANVSELMFNLWISDLQPVKMTFEPDVVILLTQTQFKQQLIISKFKDLIEESFAAAMGFPIEIQVIARENSKTNPDDSEEYEKPKEEEVEKKNPEGRFKDTHRYTFDNFIVGKSNNLAYKVSVGVANNPGVLHNPLLIHGRSGLGKTHLMMAIYNKLIQDNPNMVVIYTTGEEFMNELVECLSKKNTKAFHDKYRNVDALLMDDIQVIQKGASTQEEFFHTFDALYRAGKQIVLTSDVPAKEMVILEERIRTRLEAGIIADIQPPDIDTRKAIILRKCEQLDITIPEVISNFIVAKIKNNVRQLEGTVNKIALIEKAFNEPITLKQVEDIIKDITTDNQPTATIVEKIIDEIAKEFELQPNALKSKSREHDVVLARDVCIYVINEVTDLTYTQIGSYFSNKNHSSIHHSLKEVQAKMDRSPKAKAIAIKAIGDFQHKE